ncbi:MAG: hypothetical protein LUE25_08565, partial [Clostridiales bacterium]|nr:hypothetical protein [Clostridiales bacterium]
TEGGYTTYTCTHCGDSYVADATEATGHTAGEAVKENEVSATCTGAGSYDSVIYCSDCGVELSRETLTVPATGHNYLAVVIAPTCTEGGYTTYTCSICGDSYVADETAATGHSYEAVVTDPTCTEGGYTTYTCSICGDSYVADETAATGHSYEAVVTEPTCTDGGYTTYTCTHCGDSYVADETDATGHSWGDGVVTTEPTATTDGVMTYTCTHCGETYTEAIAATGEVESINNISISELTEVPEGLAGMYSSVTELTNDLIARVVSVSAGYSEDNVVIYDVKLQFSRDGGITWEDATEENFPAEGITVTLSYPNDEVKANYENYDFVVLHMFTSGEKAGQTETPAVTKTADGIEVTLTGFSPVAVAWKASAAASPQTGNDSIIQFGIVAILSGGASAICIGIAIRKKQRKSSEKSM